MLLTFALDSDATALSATLMQSKTMKESELCLRRVTPLPKEEGYGLLCTSIEALYLHQVNTAQNIKRTGELEVQVKELQEKNLRLENEKLALHQQRTERRRS